MHVPREGGFAVSTASLSSAQSAAQSVSDQVAQTPARLTGATPRVIASQPGWQASVGLQACLTAWERRLQNLVTEVQQISEGLHATIDNYDAAEARVVAAIQQVAAGLAARTAAGQRSAGTHGR